MSDHVMVRHDDSCPLVAVVEDTETGGLDPNKHSLLSIGFVVWDAIDGELFSDEYYVYSENYCVTKTAARLNHYDANHQQVSSHKPEYVVENLIGLRSSAERPADAVPGSPCS